VGGPFAETDKQLDISAFIPDIFSLSSAFLCCAAIERSHIYNHPGMKSVTIRDVAKAAGVSVATVSYVLNNNGRVGRPTRRAVLLAVRTLDYVANLNARNLAKDASQTLGMIVSDIENPFFPEVIKGFQQRAREQSYDVILSDTNYDAALMGEAATRMLRQRVRGISFVTSEVALPTIRQIKTRQTPAVFLDVGPVQQYISNVKVDYACGIRAVMDHLIALGHRRISFVGARNDLQSNAVRREAYVEYLRERGMKVGTLLEGNSHFDGGLAAGAQIFQLHPRPTAVVANNDLAAIGIIKALQSSGLIVPRHISVTGFDSTQIAAYTTPSLTTVDLKRDLLGRTAADALQALFTSPTHMGQEYPIVPTLQLGESTGKAGR
jgi:DNA-binding LacI/PurR family transcriptional regulator